MRRAWQTCRLQLYGLRRSRNIEVIIPGGRNLRIRGNSTPRAGRDFIWRSRTVHLRHSCFGTHEWLTTCGHNYDHTCFYGLGVDVETDAPSTAYHGVIYTIAHTLHPTGEHKEQPIWWTETVVSRAKVLVGKAPSYGAFGLAFNATSDARCGRFVQYGIGGCSRQHLIRLS